MANGRKNMRMVSSVAGIRASIGSICSCARFSAVTMTLPSREGAQLSLTGEASACGNSAEFDFDLLGAMLRLSAMNDFSQGDIDVFVRRNRYLVMCGECDRSMAVIGAISELVRAGVKKIVVTADTPNERARLKDSLELIKNTVRVTTYIPEKYDKSTKYALSAYVYDFLTSCDPEVLIIGRDCITKKTNLIRRTTADCGDELQSESENRSLISLLSKVRPAVLSSSAKISTGRSLARISEIFDPIITFVFCGEVKKLHDAVIYSPIYEGYFDRKKNEQDYPEQISL